MKDPNNQKQTQPGRTVSCDWQVDERQSIAIGHASGATRSGPTSLIRLNFQAHFFGPIPSIQLHVK
jgi:hypothetical protein